MSNIHRIMWFDREIRQQKYPSCRALAERFEISLRQANRDIEYLRNTLNAPLKYVAVKRGFMYEDITFILPNMIITAEEKKALGFLAYKYENYDGTANNLRVSRIFRNLSEKTRQNEAIPFFDLGEEYLTLFHKLKECIDGRKKAFIIYNDPAYRFRNLVIHPYDIFGKADDDYIAAFCEEYGEIRVLRLERVIEIINSNQQFAVSKDYKPEEYNPFLRKKPFKALLELESGRELTSFMGRKVIWVDDKNYEIEFHDTKQFIMDLIVSPVWTRIISPHWLKGKVRSRCMRVIEKTEQ